MSSPDVCVACTGRAARDLSCHAEQVLHADARDGRACAREPRPVGKACREMAVEGPCDDATRRLLVDAGRAMMDGGADVVALADADCSWPSMGGFRGLRRSTHWGSVLPCLQTWPRIGRQRAFLPEGKRVGPFQAAAQPRRTVRREFRFINGQDLRPSPPRRRRTGCFARPTIPCDLQRVVATLETVLGKKRHFSGNDS